MKKIVRNSVPFRTCPYPTEHNLGMYRCPPFFLCIALTRQGAAGALMPCLLVLTEGLSSRVFGVLLRRDMCQYVCWNVFAKVRQTRLVFANKFFSTPHQSLYPDPRLKDLRFPATAQQRQRRRPLVYLKTVRTWHARAAFQWFRRA